MSKTDYSYVVKILMYSTQIFIIDNINFNQLYRQRLDREVIFLYVTNILLDQYLH